jgi:hypothetical protein
VLGHGGWVKVSNSDGYRWNCSIGTSHFQGINRCGNGARLDKFKIHLLPDKDQEPNGRASEKGEHCGKGSACVTLRDRTYLRSSLSSLLAGACAATVKS